MLSFALDSAYLWHPTLNIISVALYVPAILGLKHLLRLRAPRIAVYVGNLAMICAVIGSSVLWGMLISRAAFPDKAAAPDGSRVATRRVESNSRGRRG